jgi:positive regulator of sigma E activity
MILTSLLKLVGSPLFRIVGSVLVATLIFWLTIQYGRSIERNDQLQEDLQNNLETRERIDESISNSPTDPDSSLIWLRNRNTQ